jgi:hypothetical protein
MKKLSLIVVICVMSATMSFASEYETFTRDLAKPYSFYKKSLSLTSKKEDADKAKAALASFAESWGKFATIYANDPPKKLAGVHDFASKIKRPVDVAKQSAEYLNSGNIGRAHTVLEEVRYLMWDMRIRSGIVSLADKANDFHEVMEVVFNQVGLAKEPEDAQRVYERYAPWFLLKWDEMALAPDVTSVHKDFNPAFAEGRKNVIDYLDALKQGNPAEAKKRAGAVKNAYKTIWMLDTL